MDERETRDTNLSVTQFVLSPDIPTNEREYFEKFRIMFSKIMALGNIERFDMPSFISAYEEVVLLLELGLYQEAREVMGEVQMQIQLSRSDGGFQTLFGQRGVDRREEISKVISNMQPKGKIFGLFKKKEEPQEQIRNMGMERE